MQTSCIDSYACFHHYSKAFRLCGDVENTIAANTLQMELDIENAVLQPLNILIENDFPSIQKLRKQLNSRTLDMDAARTRFESLFHIIHFMKNIWRITSAFGLKLGNMTVNNFTK